MYELLNSQNDARQGLPVWNEALRNYIGPERRRASGAGTPNLWFALMLDEVDYGMVLLGEGAQVLHVNHGARGELDARHPLQLLGRELHARTLADEAALIEAVQAATRRGLRRLLTLGDGEHRVSVAVVPLPSLGLQGGHATLVVLGKRHMCEELSVQWFARGNALTQAETRVLEALCAGDSPAEIAVSHGVGIATVRSQIGSVRQKTGAPSIGHLVRQVAVLPPLVSALRGACSGMREAA